MIWLLVDLQQNGAKASGAISEGFVGSVEEFNNVAAVHASLICTSVSCSGTKECG